MCVHEMGDGTVDSEGGAHSVRKWRGMGPLLHKMRRYGPTVLVREELSLDSLCTVALEGGAQCVRKCRGIGPPCHK